MANEVRIDLNLKGDKEAARGLKNVGDSAEKAGDGLQEMAKDAGFLDRRIVELRGEVRQLITDFDKTGDVDLLKSIRKENRQLNQFNRLKKQLGDLGTEAGQSFTKQFMSSLTIDFKGMKGPAIAGLAGLALAASPFIGATISAAVLGGTGGLGIIGGLALAATDSRVQDAAAKLGEHTMNALSRSAEPFIAPAIEAMGLLRGVVDDVSGDMRQAFSTIAPVLLPLTRGIAGLVDEAMPGFLKAMESAKPVIRALANELPQIGMAISDFFETVSEDPDGAIMAIRALSAGITNTIRFAGELVAILSNIFEGITRFGAAVNDAGFSLAGMIGVVSPLSGIFEAFTGSAQEGFDTAVEGADKAKDASGDFAGSLDDVADSASDAEQKIVDLTTAMDKFFGRTMGLHEATIRYEESIDALTESVEENGKTLDINTEKGRANRSAILARIEAINSVRKANIENNVSVEQANAIFEQQLEVLRRDAINLGLTKAQVDALVNAYKALPALAETEVRAPGLHDALMKARELTRLLGSRAAAARAAGGDTSGFLGGRAHGGPVLPGQTYVVGEDGPEVLQMGSQSGRVFSNPQSQQMLSGMSGGAAQRQVIELRAVGFNDSTFGRMWLSLLQEWLRENPGVRLTTA